MMIEVYALLGALFASWMVHGKQTLDPPQRYELHESWKRRVRRWLPWRRPDKHAGLLGPHLFDAGPLAVDDSAWDGLNEPDDFHGDSGEREQNLIRLIPRRWRHEVL